MIHLSVSHLSSKPPFFLGLFLTRRLIPASSCWSVCRYRSTEEGLKPFPSVFLSRLFTVFIYLFCFSFSLPLSFFAFLFLSDGYACVTFYFNSLYHPVFNGHKLTAHNSFPLFSFLSSVFVSVPVEGKARNKLNFQTHSIVLVVFHLITTCGLPSWWPTRRAARWARRRQHRLEDLHLEDRPRARWVWPTWCLDAVRLGGTSAAGQHRQEKPWVRPRKGRWLDLYRVNVCSPSGGMSELRS